MNELNSLSGATGWGGAGLLGLVLLWVFLRHLPAKDLQMERFIDSRDKALSAKDSQITDLIRSRDEMMRAMVDTNDRRMTEMANFSAKQEEARRSDCQQSMANVLSHSSKEHGSIMELVQRNFAELRQHLSDKGGK